VLRQTAGGSRQRTQANDRSGVLRRGVSSAAARARLLVVAARARLLVVAPRAELPGAACAGLLVAACSGLLVAACGSAPASAPASTPPGSTPPGSATTGGPGQPDRGTLARQYLAIAVAGNHHLETDFDGLRKVHGNLELARAYLRDAAATERLFDRRLMQLELPPALATVARLMVTANQARAQLADQAARSTSLAQLRGYQARLTAANAPVEDAVRVLRRMLGLPPPATS
jgi:hypothetical protein